jgi:hypothetical protein
MYIYIVWHRHRFLRLRVGILVMFYFVQFFFVLHRRRFLRLMPKEKAR